MRNAPPISRLAAGCLALALAALALTLTVSARQPIPQPPAAPAIDPDDIGGVVTGPKGPEAGVWVIAETRDLPVSATSRASSPTTAAASSCPICRAASYQVWARGYGLVDSAKATREARPAPEHHGDRRARRGRRRALLPGHLLVLDAEDSGRRSVRRQGHASRRA